MKEIRLNFNFGPILAAMRELEAAAAAVVEEEDGDGSLSAALAHDAATNAERQRCAKIAEEWGWSNKPDHARGIAEAIRSSESQAETSAAMFRCDKCKSDIVSAANISGMGCPRVHCGGKLSKARLGALEQYDKQEHECGVAVAKARTAENVAVTALDWIGRYADVPDDPDDPAYIDLEGLRRKLKAFAAEQP